MSDEFDGDSAPLPLPVVITSERESMIQVKVEDGGSVEIDGPAEVEIVGMNGRRFVLRVVSPGSSVRIRDAGGVVNHQMEDSS